MTADDLVKVLLRGKTGTKVQVVIEAYSDFLIADVTSVDMTIDDMGNPVAQLYMGPAH